MNAEYCACGRPLHYTDLRIQASVQEIKDRLGPNVTITVPGIGSWSVPRDYIALHGLRATDLPQLAERYGFERADTRPHEKES